MSTVQEKVNKALELHKSAKFEEAEALYKEVLDVDGKNPSVLNLLGLLKYQNNELDEALKYIKSAVEINSQAYFYQNLGKIYHAKKDFKNAFEAYKNALSLEPEKFDLWFDLALAFKANKQIDDAIKAYEKVISINPSLVEAYANLGSIYNNIKNNPTKAIEYYKKIIELKPNERDSEYFLGTAYLKIKEYEKGWKHYESRPSRECGILTQTLLLKDKIASKPVWQGEDLQGKTLYVYYEGGYGETTMFGRFLPLLKQKASKILFKPQLDYVKLFRDNSFGIEVIDDTSEVDFDYHVPMMSIPYGLGFKSDEDIPLKGGYLKANSDKVLEYKQKYFNTDKFKIGIKWQGNTFYDLTRKIEITSFFKLFEIPDIQFYSLQKDEGSEQLEEAKKYNIIDLGDTFNDFSDTAAAIENLDMVICNDTSVAHLAGSLGKKCWVLLPFISDWRWHADENTCTWYDTFKVFRQKASGDWDGVFEEVYRELIEVKR